MLRWIFFGLGVGTLLLLYAAATERRNNFKLNSNQELSRKIRSAIRNLIANPGSITVRSRDGVVSLSGPIFKSEVIRLIERVRSIPGVKEIENRLEIHESAEGVPGLQGRKHPFEEPHHALT